VARVPTLQDSFLFETSNQESLSITSTRGNERVRIEAVNNAKADGTFNGAPIFLKKSPLTSRVHCVGENFNKKDGWKQKSCHFVNLCFNTSAKEFVIFEDPSEADFIDKYLRKKEFLYTSTTINLHNESQSVGLGGINLKWGSRDSGIIRVKWFPNVKTRQESLEYYELPKDVIWIPFHSMNGANPGHLVWDDFFPMYTLLEMFQLLPREPQPNDPNIFNTIMPIRYILQNGERGLWASCDLRAEKTEACRKMMTKFMPLFLGRDYPYHFSTTQDFHFMTNDNGPDLVCSSTAVAGFSSLTDHGISKMHGWEEEDYHFTHNHGRGGQLYAFRNFMLQNMGYQSSDLLWHKHVTPKDQRPRHRIVISQKSSEIFVRSLDFKRQIEVLNDNLPQDEVSIEAYIFREHTLKEQLDYVLDASIFVSLCGGGAVSAMFLPAGSTVFMFYSEKGGAKNNHMTSKPAWLDWDLFNAMSHLRVHWLPRHSMDSDIDLAFLVDLAKQELGIIDSGVFH